MISQPFRNKKTGEILRQVPIMQLAEFEPYNGATCYYSAAKNCVIDLVDPAAGVTFYTLENLEEVRQRYPDAIELTLDDAAERHERRFIEPVQEITEADYWYWLEVLFPEDWRHDGGGESFKLAERTAGSITTICAKVDGRYFKLADSYTTPHAEILQRCRDYMADTAATETAPAEGTDPHTDASIQGL